MSATAYGTRILRRYDLRRFGYGLVRSGIYALGLFALAMITALLARSALISSLPAFLGEGPFGAACACTLISIFACAVWLIIDPRPLMLDTLRSNALNLYYKLGARPASLALVRPTVVLWSLLRIYLAAFALSALGGLLLSRGDAAAGFGDIALLLVAGVCALLVMVLPALFAGTLSGSRAVSSLAALASAAAVFVLLRVGGALGTADERTFANAVADLLKISPLSLSLAALACLVLFGGGAVALAMKNLTRYDELALGDEDLLALGVTKDVAVYARDGSRLSVVVSGGELTGRGEKPPDLVIDEDGELVEASQGAKKVYSAKPKKEASREPVAKKPRKKDKK